MIHRFIEPCLQRDRASVFLCLAGRQRFIGIGELISETVNGNTAGNAHVADPGRHRIRQHILHLFLGRDGHISFRRLHDIGRAEIGIRLCADDAHINGRTDGAAGGNGCAVDTAHPFRHLMCRIQRHIALVRADFHIAFRIGLRGRIQIIDIDRAGQSQTRTAAALDGNICPILGILRRKRHISLRRTKCRPVTGIGFRVLDDFCHRKSDPAATAAETDAETAVSAAKRRVIRRRQRNPVLCSQICTLPGVSAGRGMEHIGAHRTGDTQLSADTARHRRIRQIRRMRGRNIRFTRLGNHPRLFRQIRIRRSRKGNRGIGETHAARRTAADTARTGSLREARISPDRHVSVHIYISILSDISIRRIIHECLGRASRHAEAFAPRDAERGRRRRGITRIRRFDGQRRLFSRRRIGNIRILSHGGLHRLVDHFHGSRKPGADFAFRRSAGRAAARRKRRHIARRDAHISCIPEIRLCRIFLIFADIRLRVRRDIMRPGRTGTTAILEPDPGRRRNRRHFFGRIRRHIRFRRVPQFGTALDAAVRVPDVFLHIDRRADPRPFGNGEAARHAEKIGFVLRFDCYIAVLRVVFPFAQIRIRRLRHMAHRDRARTREEILAAGRTDGDHFRFRIVFGIGCRAVVGILRRDGNALRLPRRIFLFIAGRIRRDRRMIHHDGERCPDRRIFGNADRPDTDRRRAVIASRNRQRANIECLASADIGLDRIVDGTPGNGETAGKFPRAGRRCRDRGQIALFFRRDGKTAGRFACRRLAERRIFRETFRISFDNIHIKRAAHSLSFVIFGNRKRTGVRIDRPGILRLD